jgi:CRISPR-associated endonuclease/helicase Cas3
MVFSALVDSDYLDTERFYSQAEGWPVERGDWHDLDELRNELFKYMAGKMAEAEPTPVNQLRRQLLDYAITRATEPPGLFTLTVPTGGGKTLTSLGFALTHALAHGLDRVIYVIPYTSIIEQTADVFRSALGDLSGNVLEHHSAYREAGPRAGREKLRLATENWDAPIIVTTAVQFFESLFSDRPGRCRKLHNIARSAIILDEAQTLPLPLLRPCMAVMDELARNYAASVVLCTATQPALIERPGEVSRSFAGGFRDVLEIAPEPARLYEQLRRVRIRCVGKLSDADLIGAMREAHQVLAVVNTRRHAYDLYAALKGVEGAMHLSALMCPEHRSQVLDTIRQRLRNGQVVRLVTTAVIEAGVDVDFGRVYRATAGLDQIAQAAGRCNREGLRAIEDSVVTVFETEQAEPRYMRMAADAARAVFREYSDPLSLEAIEAYFRRLYWARTADRDGLDVPRILPRLNEHRTDLFMPHEAVALDMRLIENGGEAVIIPWDSTARRLIASLETVERVAGIARQLQRYVVSVYDTDFAQLRDSGAIQCISPDRLDDQFWVLTNVDRYRADVGLDIWGQSLGE